MAERTISSLIMVMDVQLPSTLLIMGFLLLSISLFHPYSHYINCKNHASKFTGPLRGEKKPDLTILLPMKNEETNVGEKIDEILNMTYDPKKLKILLIISNSKDKTEELARAKLKNSKTEIVWRIISDSYPSKSQSLKASFHMIKTDFFIMMDADSRAPPDSLLRLTDWFQDPNIGAVCGHLETQRNLPNNSYRSRFNIIRFGESMLDSTPLFEGSLCAFRIQALANKSIADNINADDTQLSIISRLNGFKSIMDRDLSFYDVQNYSRRRGVRRAQGICRVLFINKNSCFGLGQYSSIMRNTLFFYLLFPWLFSISATIIILTSIVNLFSMAISLNSLPYAASIASILALLFTNVGKNLFSGVSVLIESQLRLLLGIKLNAWVPNRQNK